MKYLVIVEETDSGFSAYSPDVPGCIATGATPDEVKREMADAISFHLDGLRAEGLELPSPHATSTYIDVPA